MDTMRSSGGSRRNGTETSPLQIQISAADRWKRARSGRVSPPTAAASTSLVEPIDPALQGRPPEAEATAAATRLGETPSGHLRHWDLERLSRIEVLGLGSIGPPQPPPLGCSRMPYRVMQLALALALARRVKAEVGRSPSLSFADPAFTPWDVQLLESLGGSVVHTGVANRVKNESLGGSLMLQDQAVPDGSDGSALYFMPACPRSLYSSVLQEGAVRGTTTAILGTSLQSLAVSEAPPPYKAKS